MTSMATTIMLFLSSVSLWQPPLKTAVPTTFKGGLLGVSAVATLYQSHATITLSGLPFGGSITGEAMFSNANGLTNQDGSVYIKEPLLGALRRRHVSVLNVRAVTSNELVVVLSLPIFGQQSIALVRSDT